MNENRSLLRHRSLRTLLLRLALVLGVVLVDVFFLAMLDNLFSNQKRAIIILEPSDERDALFDPIEPIRTGLGLLNKKNITGQKKFLEKEVPPVFDGDNPWFRVVLTDAENNIVYEYEKREKLKQWNDASNCFISRSFESLTTLKDINVAFYYTSPKGWSDIESLVYRFWGYAAYFVAASWGIFFWLSRTFFRPLERVGRAIEIMIQSDRVVLIAKPKHAIEHRFNRMARYQREVIFGLEVEGIVDELHSLADDAEVVDRFFQSAIQAIQKIYPFQQVFLYSYSQDSNQFSPLSDGAPSWPKDQQAESAVFDDGCAIPLKSGGDVLGGLYCQCNEKTEDMDERIAMASEIKKQVENGLARAFTRSRTLTEERNRFGINLATNMGHDLTNIIASGKWDLDTIQRVQNLGFVTMDPKKGPFFLEAVDGLKNNLHFLQEMVDIYRSFGYTRSPRYERVDLLQVVEQVSTLFRLSSSQKLSVVVSESEPVEIHAEPRLLRMALFNLMANSAQAIRRSDPRMNGEINLSVDRSSNGLVTVTIQDNGPGIRNKEGALLRRDEIRRIFQSGYSTKENASGGGLGLSWVKSIVEDFHKGSIQAENRAEGGAQFTISIPIQTPDEPASS